MHRLLLLFLIPNLTVLFFATAGRFDPTAAAELLSQQTRGLLAIPSAAPPPPAEQAAPAAPPAAFPELADWTPPAWLAGTDAQSIPALDIPGPQRGGPRLRSRGVMIFDVDAGRVLYEKQADNRRPVASLTKVTSALTLAAAGGDLDREVCIGAEQYPTRSGAFSKLHTGDCATGWDYLGAALVSSDNRAAYALASSAGMGVDEFIWQMNQTSASLGMSNSSWADPSGLEDENLSTARDMARATLALSSVPALALAASAPSWMLERAPSPDRQLFTTNKLSGRRDLDFFVTKTGYTDTARYCFTSMLQTASGRRVIITLLGAERSSARWADVRQVLRWLETVD